MIVDGTVMKCVKPSKYGDKTDIGRVGKIYKHTDTCCDTCKPLYLIDNDPVRLYYEDAFEPIQKFKVGDKVKVIGKSWFGSTHHIGDEIIVYRIDEGYHRAQDRYATKDANGNCSGVYLAGSLQLIPTKKGNKNAVLITEKFVSGGLKCRRVIGYRNIKKYEELPVEYLRSGEWFFADTEYCEAGDKVINGVPNWSLTITCRDGFAITMNDKYTDDIETWYHFSSRILKNSEYTEETFQKLLKHLKAAGEQLAQINRANREKFEKDKLEKEWSGQEEVEIIRFSLLHEVMNMKIVINACYGGFSISKKAAEFMASRGSEQAQAELDEFEEESKNPTNGITKEFGAQWYGYGYGKKFKDGYNRTDSNLIAAVEELKEKANGEYSKLKIIQIPDDTDWEISEYDGWESVEEKHRSWN